MTLSNITDLKKFKANKKAKLVYYELLSIIKILDLTLNALRHYSKYGIVVETISVLNSNKTLLEIHCRKYEKLVSSKAEPKEPNDEQKN